MDRSEKEQLVASLKETLDGATSVVITRQSGLTVSEVQDLRAKMREAGGSYKVAKNRLVKLAVKGGALESLGEHLTGPTAVAASDDAVAAAKVIAEFAKTNEKIEIVAGALDGEVLDKAGIETLAKLPSLDELRGKIIGVLNAPASKVVGVVGAPAAQLARVFAAQGAKDAA